MKKFETIQQDLENEEWRDLVRFPQTKGIYYISNLGRYKRKQRKGGFYYSFGQDIGDGHKRVDLRVNGIKIGRVAIHILVAEAFIRPIRKGEDVHHINSIKSENNIQNLKIESHIEHRRHHALDDLRLKDPVTGKFIKQ